MGRTPWKGMTAESTKESTKRAQKTPLEDRSPQGEFCLSGSVLVSHRLPPAVQSALKGLTSGFGMEPGVSLSLWPPKLYENIGRTPPPGGFVDRIFRYSTVDA